MIWVIGDLHLSFGTPGKKMDIFGPNWVDHEQKIADHWSRVVKPDDLVLIPGDISWAKKMDDAIPDLEWIHSLPGTKVMIKGNHDYWWESLSKVRAALPSSLHVIQNDVFKWNEMEIGGARLWDTPEFSFEKYVIWKENPKENKDNKRNAQEDEKIFERELQRLEMSLQKFSKGATRRIVMTHYPPVSADLQPSRAHKLLKKYHVDTCVFGHLHNMKPRSLPFGKLEGIHYLLTSCDYTDFYLLKLN